MKSLDEVIALLEDPRRADVPHYKDDLLFHLKNYRDSKEDIDTAMERYTRATLQHMDAAEKLEAQRFVLEYDNPPLTWDELREMEGKPVWVESHGNITEYTGWAIVKRVLPDRVHFLFSEYDDEYGYEGLEMAVLKSYIGISWQAYRKERE